MKKIFFFILYGIILFSSNAQNKNCMNVVILTAADSIEERYGNPIYQRDFNDYFYVENNQIYSNKDKKPFSGKIKIIYSSGQTFAELYYNTGVENGTQYYYYETGKKQSVFNKSNGIAQGIQYYYYENGKKMMEQTYKNNIIDGITIYYYEDETKESEGYLKGEPRKERKLGHWIYYYRNGKKKEEGEWKIGGRHGDGNIQTGIWKYYDEKGNLIKTEEYNKISNEKNTDINFPKTTNQNKPKWSTLFDDDDIIT
jgi:antitoxin component YwqK of YwqJK toxin-antitoxin module